MKKFTNLVLGLFLVSSLFMGCQKDDNSANNYLMVGNTKYAMAQGTIENNGLMQGDSRKYDGYNLDLTLYSGGFTLSTDDNGELNVSGTGHMIYLEIYTSSAEEYDNLEYTYSDSYPAPVGTFDYGDYVLNYSPGSIDYKWIEITSGSVTISKSGSIYTIIIDCIDEEGNSVSGYFKGALQYFDNTTSI